MTAAGIKKARIVTVVNGLYYNQPVREEAQDDYGDVEAEIKAMWIEAYSCAPGRVNIRISEYMREIGRKGGSVTSPKKAAASAANGKKGGRPRKAPGEEK